MEVRDQREHPIFIHHQLDDAGLDPYAFRIYCRIARRAGSRGDGCTESVPSMARGCQTTPKRVRKAMETLEDRGMISRQDRPGRTTEVSLLPHPRWNRTPCEITPGENAGTPPAKCGGTPPAKSQDKDTPLEDTPFEEGGAPAREDGSGLQGEAQQTKTEEPAEGTSDALDEQSEEEVPRATKTFTLAGESYSVDWRDPVTGDTLAEMKGRRCREMAVKGWPLGQSIADAADHPGVEVHREFYPETASGFQRELIAKTLTDAVDAAQRAGKPRYEAAGEVMDCWRETLSFWKGNGYKARSVKRQLEKLKELRRQAEADAARQRAPGRVSSSQFDPRITEMARHITA